MNPREVFSAIQTLHFPAFLAALEGLYGKKFLEKHFACMGVINMHDGSSMIETFGTGTMLNLLTVAHGAIRGIVTTELTLHKPNYTAEEEVAALKQLMNTLWLGLTKDIGRQGVPDSIFEGFIKNQA